MSTALTPTRVVGGTDRVFGALLGALNAAASVGIVVLVALICADVALRALFNRPIIGVTEIVKMSVVCIGWMQFAYTLRNNRHLRSTMIFDLLPRYGQCLVYALNCLGGVAIFGLIAWYASDDVAKTFRAGTFEGELPVRIKVWPVCAILVLGSGLLALQYLVHLVMALCGRLPFGTAPDRSQPVGGAE